MISVTLTTILILQTIYIVNATEKDENEIRQIIYEALLSEDLINAEVALDEDYRIKSIKDILGNYAYYQYDDEGVNIIRNNKLDTRFTFDESGEIIRYKNFFNDTELNYSYDTEGNLVGIKNDDYDYTIKKDKGGVPIELRRDGNLLFKNKLDGEKILSKNFGNGQEVSYFYNNLGLVESIDTGDEPLFSFDYNENGFVEEIINHQRDTSINYLYDDLNICSIYDNDTEITSIYDDNENIIKREIYTDNYNYDIEQNYNSEDTLDKIITGENYFKYKTDKIGFEKEIENNFGTFTEEYIPDYQNGKLVGYEFNSGDDTYYCTFNNDGMITQIQFNDDLIYEFEYDDMFGQITVYKDHLLGESHTYEYDDTGNIIYKSCECKNDFYEVDYEYNNYDWADQFTAYDGIKVKYDSIGNMTKFGDKSYKWKQGNLLSSYSDDSNEIEYYYDENGVRIGKTVNGEEITYIVDGYQVLVENVDGHELVYIYIYDELLGFYFDGEIFYYKTNPLGDIIGIYDENLNQVVKYEYDIWGNILNISGDKAETVGKYNPYRYRGYRYDEETNLYYLYSRYYSPELCRFISADSYVGEPGSNPLSNNLYAYCLNNPVIYRDPYGYELVVAIGLGATVTIGSFILGLMTVTAIEGYCDDIAGYLDDLISEIGRNVKEHATDFAEAIASAASKANQKTYRHPTNDHHIVAQTSSKASVARTIYEKTFGTGQINNSRNIVTIRTSLHVHLHSDLYYKSVNRIMQAADNSGSVSSALKMMKGALKAISNICP